jgi:hypothetical protein
MAWSPSKWRAVVLDFLERAGWSAGEVFFAILLAGGTATTVTSLPWKYALTLAASAAVASIVLTAIQYLGRLTNLSFWPDVLVRLAKTFLSSLAASFGADLFDVTKFHWTTALNVAVLATLAALGKGLLAREPGALKQSTVTTPAGTTTAPAVPTQPSPSTLTPETYAEAARE